MWSFIQNEVQQGDARRVGARLGDLLFVQAD
jgi:hypothetical protein